MKALLTPLTLAVLTLTALAQAPEKKPEAKPLDYVAQLAKGMQATREVVYKKVGDRELKLFIFEPKGFKPSDQRACLVTIHGGGWTGGEPGRMFPFAARAAELGMVGISVQYRLYKPGSEVTVFDCVKDGRSALRYVRAHAAELGIDPQKIVAQGGSAGGHVAAATAIFDGVDEAGEDTKVSCVPNALVLLFPVIDTSKEGYGNQKIGERWKELSPAHQVRPGLPPTIVFHGTGDTTTPFKGAQDFHDAMIKAGNRCELVVNEGGAHGYLMREKGLYEEAQQKTETFFGSLGFIRVAKSAASTPAGILLDDGAGQFTGDWVESTKKAAFVGAGYRHDDNKGKGTKKARFIPEIAQGGDYEVRLIYAATSNRATNAKVTVTGADGAKTLVVNEREEVMENGVPRALGTFKFAAGNGGSVEISNEGADGFVVVDAVQFVPMELALAERAGKSDAGFGKIVKVDGQAAQERKSLAAAVAFSPLTKPVGKALTSTKLDSAPVQLAKDAPAAEVDGKSYDLVVVGGTGSGVMCAVRAAREGCSVLLVQHNRHLGGMMANGLMQWDALYGGPRAPLFSELLSNIEKHYIEQFGRDSHEHQTVRCTHEHYPISWAEPHVSEREFNRLVAGERNVTVLLSHFPVAVERDGALLRNVTLREYGGTKEIRVKASAFADATYEGDLFAVAKVPYRSGREARDEFGEPHAGKVFANIDSGQAPKDAVEGKLNIRPYGSHQGSVDPSSPFTADRAVQAYNYRFCVTRDSGNIAPLTEPPPGYNRDEYVHYGRKSISTNAGPNLKSHMNSPILPGENHDYPEADWTAREKIIERHKNFALGLMWFLQNDESVSPAQRAKFREWGLPKDEFGDHGHIPYEMYVREARRIVGRHVFKEQDNSLAPGLGRTPIFPDSVAITDWYMDSHSCTNDSRPGFHYDGKLILTEESRPAQIPYRSLLPQGVDNLLVPLCLSATHIAWGAIRLEPVWMSTGEAAGLAAALAKREKTTPAQLDSDLLVRTLVERRQLVSFFNEVKVDGPEPWIPAMQYFATKGFFADYDARPGEPLSRPVAEQWARTFAALVAKTLDAGAEAKRLTVLTGAAPAVTGAEFVEVLKMVRVPEALVARVAYDLQNATGPLSRAEACRALYAALTGVPRRTALR